MGEVFTKKPLRKTLKTVYEDLNIAFDAVVEGNVTNGSITDAKLATDVKVGSLAALTTAAKGSVQAAINEVDGNADTAQSTANAKYSKPGGGIPSTDMTAAVIASLGKADTAMQGNAAITAIRANKIQLNGTNPSPVNFIAADAATLLGSATGNFDFKTALSGKTFIVNPDAAGNVTKTFDFASGTSISGASPSTDISAETDDKFKISVDGDTAELVTLTLAGLSSGAAIATEMQTKIQALGGKKTGVTVDYNVTSAGKYCIASADGGTGSTVVVTPATTGSITEELKIGIADGGAETNGTGDFVLASAVTPAEVATAIAALTGLTATVEDGKIRITSDTTGRLSKLVVGNGTGNTLLGFTNTQTDCGAQGLSYASNMADANYIAVVSLDGTAQASLASKNVSITNKATTGFTIECETAAATDYVDVIVVGVAA